MKLILFAEHKITLDVDLIEYIDYGPKLRPRARLTSRYHRIHIQGDRVLYIDPEFYKLRFILEAIKDVNHIAHLTVQSTRN